MSARSIAQQRMVIKSISCYLVIFELYLGVPAMIVFLSFIVLKAHYTQYFDRQVKRQIEFIEIAINYRSFLERLTSIFFSKEKI